ncbi:LlaJI family restriction endonuclease [Pseudoduganella sp. FT93W]|uniref:LlaJI family restriction endonuclease n=1 Tax=Duganella fentianensis TaxID=2692177 RepID=A0A845I1F9_9BURK|nr:LlaJI family restriction endonuclease [Duganella fentianensis]MYN45917.1 LlaJI family restriction endonuclease [Duganella fentianensis]
MQSSGSARSGVKIRLVEDRCALGVLGGDGYPVWLKEEIVRRGLVADGEQTISFCGLIAQDSEVFVFIPRGSALPVTIAEKDSLAALTTSCLELYGRRRPANTIPEESGLVEFEQDAQLALVRELLDDYRLNGLYATVSRQQTSNNGRTDWRRTIRMVAVLPDADGMPIYPELIGTRRCSTLDSIVTRIHGAVISKLDEMFGWWVTGEAGGRLASDLDADPDLLDRAEYCIAMLKHEMVLVYSDRHMRLIRNLLRYFRHHKLAGGSPVVIGLRDFHWVWEYMLAEITAWRKDVSRELPVPVYYAQNGERQPAPGKGMRPDLVLGVAARRHMAVVDAKYYQARDVSTAPGWHDLVKQFFYAKALQEAYPGWTVDNIFVFPGCGKLSYAAVESRDRSRRFDELFPPVRCVYIDPVQVMQHFIAGTLSTEITESFLMAGRRDA